MHKLRFEALVYMHLEEIQPMWYGHIWTLSDSLKGGWLKLLLRCHPPQTLVALWLLKVRVQAQLEHQLVET